MHAYEKLPLNIAGYLLALLLIAGHLWMLRKPSDTKQFFLKFPRNTKLGQILMGVGIFWFWLLIIPDKFFFSSPLAMDLQDFNSLKFIMAFAVPLVGYLVITECKEFISVRGLGLCLLMAAAPLLAAAWQEPHTLKNLIPLYAYLMIIKGLFMVGMPYLTRDLIGWATADSKRFKLLCTGGLVYGVIVLTCSIFMWN